MLSPDPNLMRILVLAVAVSAAVAAEADGQPLFRSERSKNANVVQYDARVQEDGSLDPDEPVDAYWRRASGRRKELKWLQRQMAYGFAVHWNPDRTGLELEMKAPIGRRVQIVRVENG